jgi:metallophosphoesterase (TIGR00282 family)
LINILLIGDIVGRPGREIVKKHLLKVKEEYEIDLVVANGENVSHGFGITIKNAHEMLDGGVDIFTSGNHIWDKKEMIEAIDSLPILRPINYPASTNGKGVKVVEIKGKKVAIISAMGHYTMPMCDNPFLIVPNEVKRLKDEGAEIIIIDFHAEATSEKETLFHMLKDDVDIFFGTHTHVGTDDMRIENGSFYVTDIGLSGCRDGVIGMDKASPIKRFTTALPASFDVPKRCKKIFQAIVVRLEEEKVTEAFKLKSYSLDKSPKITQNAFNEM